MLLWVERWYDAARTQQRDADDADVRLYRRFVEVLERDFARHHDVGHYADELRGPAGGAVARALAGHRAAATKELVTDRVMLEAARLLRFTDLSVGEVAFRVGIGRPALLLAGVQAPLRRGADGLSQALARARRG